jgi:hypothetical protein
MTQEVTADLRFSITPEWVLDADISDRAVRVYGILARYADSETLQAFPSRETLAKRAKCHWRSVDRALDELVAIGAIVKRHRKTDKTYQSNLYTLKRVPPTLSGGTDTPVSRVLTPVSGGTDTAGNLTITTELEPKELYKGPKTADDYNPSTEFLQTLAGKYEGVNLQVELEKFRDYHVAKGSRFKVWDRAFSRWVAQAWEWSPAAKEVRARRAVEEELERYKRENGVD